MEQLLDEFRSTMDIPWSIWSARLVGTVVLCGLIGFEREVDKRQAGIRTHILVGLASALYCIVMQHLVVSDEFATDRVRTDPIRVVEAVTQGVAFLAAGLVVFHQGNVRGLKTGATMWLSAAIGLACGLGLWGLAVTTTIIAIVIIVLFRKIEQKAGTHVPGHKNAGEKEA
ncbi:MgtC/SapB family protein [Lutimaribacter marinistellae]|uniref:Protein MgtC n=1 Tax=Lutimaribacter marinistellae TaxID=1820329 RepID=A0ABV7TCD9_9RHOB